MSTITTTDIAFTPESTALAEQRWAGARLNRKPAVPARLASALGSHFDLTLALFHGGSMAAAPAFCSAVLLA
jgi:hypothetical protein